MPKEIVNTGSVPNDGTGDPLRTALTQTNANMDEIYATFGDGTNLTGIGTTAAVGYADVAGVATFAQGLINGPNITVGICTGEFISAASQTPVRITHSGTTLTFTVAGIGSANLTLA